MKWPLTPHDKLKINRLFFDSPARPGPPAAGCAAAATGRLQPGTPGCTGSSGSLPAPFGSLWSTSETVLSWPGSADPWSVEEECHTGKNIIITPDHEHLDPRDDSPALTTTASAVAPSALMTGAELITAVVRGVWMALASWVNSGCFFLMCCTILVCRRKRRFITNYGDVENQPSSAKRGSPCCCTAWRSVGSRPAP